MSNHGHDDCQPCGLNCPVGPVRIHFDDSCDHADGNVCQGCAALTDEEVAALREYFQRLHAGKPRKPLGAQIGQP